MKLVIEYQIGDDYTWGATLTLPVEYESAEAFLVDFEELVMKTRADFIRDDTLNDRSKPGDGWLSLETEFTLAGHRFSWDRFWSNEDKTIYPPRIMTIDEWFKQHQQ